MNCCLFIGHREASGAILPYIRQAAGKTCPAGKSHTNCTHKDSFLDSFIFVMMGFALDVKTGNLNFVQSAYQYFKRKTEVCSMETDMAFAKIAKREGLSIQQVRADMIAAIHQAYLEGKPEFKVIFGDREPTPEEFIQAIAKDFTNPTPLQ